MKSYTFEPTTDPDLQRVVDRQGEWTHYFHVPSGKFLRGVTYILRTGFAKGPRFYEYLKNSSKDEIEQKLNSAGEHGTHVHEFVADLLKNGGSVKREEAVVYNKKTGEHMPITDDEWDAVLSFEQFWNRHAPVLIQSERPTYNLKEGYAGTMDLIVVMTKACGVRACPCGSFINQAVLLDIKTSAGIWDDYGGQVAAYANAENINELMPKGMLLNSTGILRLGTSHKTTGGYQLEIYDIAETNKHWDEFRAAITVSNATYKPFDPAIDIVDIKENIALDMTGKLPEKKVEEPKEVKVNVVKKPKKAASKTAKKNQNQLV